MASFFDKVRIRTAAGRRNKMTYDQDHITTSDFFVNQVVFSKQLVPNTDFKVSALAFSRLQPLTVPTFGRADIRLRAFFVPYHTVFRGWFDFISDSVNVAADTVGLESDIPRISGNEIFNLFFNSTYQSQFGTSGTGVGENIDFVGIVRDSQGIVTQEKPIVLWPNGRQMYKVLLSLGYQIICEGDSSVANARYFNALPLLCYGKAMCDWYMSSQYYGQISVINEVMKLFEKSGSSGVLLTATDLGNILSLACYSHYDDDYFTSAWDNPTSPNLRGSSVVINDIEISGRTGETGISHSVVTSSAYGSGSSPEGTVPNIHGVNTAGASTASPYNVTQYILDSLKALTDWFKRNQFAGGRAMDRFKARFGIKPSVEELHRSRYLGAHSVPLQIGDVFSSADTDGAGLGDFAGRGYAANDDMSWSVDTGSDYGQFIILATIVPRVGYVQGLSREVLQRSRFDFWSPEFDALGSQAISKSELFIPQDLAGVSSSVDVTDMFIDKIFGFTPRYSHYKVGRDQLSGDFMLSSRNVGLSSWHMFRLFDNPSLDDLTHSWQFTLGRPSVTFVTQLNSTQYDRIFANTTGTDDHFICYFRFDVSMLTPMRNLYDVYQFDDTHSGDETSIPLNGTQLN